MVAQCEITGKWFCNGHVAPGGTCVIQHLVRGRYKEVRLHPQSPLGNTILECYHSGSRNIFSLGFVPVKGDDTIVLLARDTPVTASCVKELDLNMNLWESIIQVCWCAVWRNALKCDCYSLASPPTAHPRNALGTICCRAAAQSFRVCAAMTYTEPM
jgi:hypothetical protein